MACHYPLDAWRSLEVNPSGKRSIVFDSRHGFMPFKLPCGKCLGCRLEYSRQWAIRCMHESSLYEDNAFITLTYNDENLPKYNSLVKSDFQDFMKRLRHKFGQKIRYFMCGEYGPKLGRPHFHAIIFNADFEDKKFWLMSNDQKLYRSPMLESVWKKGYSSVGNVTFESAAYVARYVTKKITGDMAIDHYATHDPDTFEIVHRLPEYADMSRRGGIGLGWYQRYKHDVYFRDQVIVKGVPCKPPKYYDGKFNAEYPDEFNAVRKDRVERGKIFAEHSTPERLAIRAKILESKVNKLVRPLV